MATSGEKGSLTVHAPLNGKRLVSLHQLSFSYHNMSLSYTVRLSGISAVSYDGWTFSPLGHCSSRCCPLLYFDTSST